MIKRNKIISLMILGALISTTSSSACEVKAIEEKDESSILQSSETKNSEQAEIKDYPFKREFSNFR